MHATTALRHLRRETPRPDLPQFVRSPARGQRPGLVTRPACRSRHVDRPSRHGGDRRRQTAASGCACRSGSLGRARGVAGSTRACVTPTPRLRQARRARPWTRQLKRPGRRGTRLLSGCLDEPFDQPSASWSRQRIHSVAASWNLIPAMEACGPSRALRHGPEAQCARWRTIRGCAFAAGPPAGGCGRPTRLRRQGRDGSTGGHADPL
jgi:hypothetical protein